MNRIFYMILSAVLLFGSCTREIPLNRRPLEEILVVHALMHSSDTLHNVRLKISNDEGLANTDRNTSSVRCTVNGSDVPVRLNSLRNGFVVEAVFRPGDRVRLDAYANGLHAYSEVVVPQQVDVELADTVERVEYGPQYKDVTIFSNLRIKDIPGEKNFYRIGDLRHLRHELHRRWEDEMHGIPGPDLVKDVWGVYNNNIDMGEDPVLRDDYLATEENDLLSTLNPTNYYRVFSDRLFADDDVEVRVSFKEGYLDHYDYYEKPYESWSSVNLVVEHITTDAYYYYKALNAGKTNGYDSYGGLIMEPVVIPSNVVGGLGYVNVSMDSPVSIMLRHYRLDYDGNAVEIGTE